MATNGLYTLCASVVLLYVSLNTGNDYSYLFMTWHSINTFRVVTIRLLTLGNHKSALIAEINR